MKDYKKELNNRVPWLDVRIGKEAIDYLWDIINNSTQEINAKRTLAGNISKSRYIEDKENLFYERVLKEASEIMYFKDSWKDYFDVVVTKKVHFPVFALDELWMNYQKQYEFNPPHNHSGKYSFVVFMKIPTHWKEQHALPWSANSNMPCASDFQFLIGQEQGTCRDFNFPLSSTDEGRMLFFPAWLTHQVFPFYGTEPEEERITMSGNIVLYNNEREKNDDD